MNHLLITLYCCAIAVLLLLSAFFSAVDTSYSVVNKLRLEKAAQKGGHAVKLAYAYAQNYDKTIATILFGNSLVNILATSLGTLLAEQIFPNSSDNTTGSLLMSLYMAGATGSQTLVTPDQYLYVDESGKFCTCGSTYSFVHDHSFVCNPEYNRLPLEDLKIAYSNPAQPNLSGAFEIRIQNHLDEFDQIGTLVKDPNAPYRRLTGVFKKAGGDLHYPYQVSLYNRYAIDKRNLRMKLTRYKTGYDFTDNRIYLPSGLGQVYSFYSFAVYCHEGTMKQRNFALTWMQVAAFLMFLLIPISLALLASSPTALVPQNLYQLIFDSNTRMDGVDEVADDFLFVAGGKDEAITVIFGLLLVSPTFAK